MPKELVAFPCGSISTISVGNPKEASAAPKLIVVVVSPHHLFDWQSL